MTPSADRSQVRFNYEDLLQMPEDGRRYEVIEGDLIVSPSPNYGHQFVVSNLLILLGSHVRSGVGGVVLAAPFDVKFDFESVVEPDLLYFRKDRTPKQSAKFASVAPELAVEVLSPSSHERDLGAKKKLSPSTASSITG